MRIQVEGVPVRRLRSGTHLSPVLCPEARNYRICRARPATDRDDRYVGIVAVPCEALLNACPGSSCAQRHVFKVINDALSERVTTILNGWIHCAQVIIEDESHCMLSFLSEEEVHEYAVSEYSVVCYSEVDFEKEIVCKLKAANSGIMFGRLA